MRPSNTLERRNQIVDALIAVMAQHGYDGATTALVAQQAGLTQGLVHYHFKNKREILLAMLERVRQHQTERLARRLEEAGPSAWERLQTVLTIELGLGSDADPALLACWIMLGGEALRDETVREAYGAVLTDLATAARDIIQAGQASGELGGPAPEVVVGALMALIQGYFVVSATGRSLIPRGSAAQTSREMLRGLLQVPDP